MTDKTGQRLMSLDALRGFDMFWILYPTYPIFHALLVALGMKGCWLDLQMDHLPWIGFTFYDTIYPLFLFMAGVSWPYSYAGSRKRGLSTMRISLRIVKRVILLVALGACIFGSLQFNPKTFTLTSVLGRIGIAWAVAAFVYMSCGWRGRLVAMFAVLAVYGAVPFFVAAPGAPAGVLPYAEPAACLYAWMDGNLFPQPLVKAGASGVFCMIATALMGMFAGDLMRRDCPSACKLKTLLAWTAGSLALGLLVAFGLGRFSIPVIKLIWSPSYALVAGAYSFAMLALFHWIVDVRGWRGWTLPFRVIGMNAMFAYLGSRTIFPYNGQKEFLFGGVARLMPTPEWGEFAAQFGYMAVYWGLLYLMYRKQIFVKV